MHIYDTSLFVLFFPSCFFWSFLHGVYVRTGLSSPCSELRSKQNWRVYLLRVFPYCFWKLETKGWHVGSRNGSPLLLQLSRAAFPSPKLQIFLVVNSTSRLLSWTILGGEADTLWRSDNWKLLITVKGLLYTTFTTTQRRQWRRHTCWALHSRFYEKLQQEQWRTISEDE